MSKSTKIIVNILLITIIILANTGIVYGTLNASITAVSGSADTKVSTIAGSILSVVQTVGVAVATIMLVVLAIKYIAASPNDKAEIKKHAIVYVIGAVLLYGAAGVLQIIKNLGQVVAS